MLRAWVLLACVLAGCIDALVPSEEPRSGPAGEAEHPELPGLWLHVAMQESTVHGRIENRGEATYTIVGTGGDGCAPSFRIEIKQSGEMVRTWPEAVCAIYVETEFSPGDSMATAWTWDLRDGNDERVAPGRYDVSLLIHVHHGTDGESEQDPVLFVASTTVTVS